MTATTTSARPVHNAPAVPLVLSTKRVLITTFLVLLPLNLVLLVFAFSIGVTTGFNGEFGFSWNDVGTTINAMFGSFGNFITLIGALALLAFIYWISNKLSRKYGWLPGVLVLAALALGVVVYWSGWINLEDINVFGLVPFLFVILFTALQAAVITLALRYIKWKTPSN